jgi:hypothetical protein
MNDILAEIENESRRNNSAFIVQLHSTAEMDRARASSPFTEFA